MAPQKGVDRGGNKRYALRITLFRNPEFGKPCATARPTQAICIKRRQFDVRDGHRRPALPELPRNFTHYWPFANAVDTNDKLESVPGSPNQSRMPAWVLCHGLLITQNCTAKSRDNRYTESASERRWPECDVSV